MIRRAIKTLVFSLLGKDSEAVVVSFLSADPPLAWAMLEEVRRLLPDRRHFAVSLDGTLEIPGVSVVPLEQMRRALRRYRVGIAPVLFTPDRRYAPLRRAAFRLAPTRILAYNTRLERHHLRLATWIASWLFLRGVPLDRIWLRPRWLFPWRKDRTVVPDSYRAFQGRPLAPGRRRIGVLTPYFPYPLTHGGAVRIFHLLREMAREFDVFLFAFTEENQPPDMAPLLEHCARIVLVAKPRYREPRWASWFPEEVCAYRCPAMSRALQRLRREHRIEALQVEYTFLAPYGGHVLVEHDVTMDLYRQVFERERTLSSWWNWWRWRRFETRSVRRFPRVVVMSERDAALLRLPQARVIGNGVDLERFVPAQERPGRHLLFVGSFRHFPNLMAYRFFIDQVWPRLRPRFPDLALTVVAGPEPELYWREFGGAARPPSAEGVRLLGFVADLRPLYLEANLVIVPTLVSAGTNLKVLEAMAMERAVVSTPCGCAGLGLRHGESVWIAEDGEGFAQAVVRLLEDHALRRRIARAARAQVEKFDWKSLGEAQRALLREVLPPRIEIRDGGKRDLAAIARIQSLSPQAAQWEPRRYLAYQLRVAVAGGSVAGFLACRQTAKAEFEILNLAVDPDWRRQGLGAALLRDAMTRFPGEVFLEVRESNLAAQSLYRKLGFRLAGTRPRYYENPEETAIVMKFQSC